MGIDGLLALGAALLLLTAVVVGLRSLRSGFRRSRILIGVVRLSAALLLLAALMAAVADRGRWSAFDLRQVALALALAATLIHLALAARARLGNPLTDLAAAILALSAALVILPGIPPLDCVHHLPLRNILWLCLLLGSGGVIVAGSGGASLALAVMLSGREWAWPPRAALHSWLKEATQVGLVFLGGGLALLALATWWAVGTPISGDPREIWLAAAWLTAAMSWQAWQLGRRAARWAAVLAMLAAGVVIIALLVLPDLA